MKNSIITLTGPNAFLLHQALQKQILDFTKSHGDLAIERHDGEEAELSVMTESLTASGLFAKEKLVILRSPSANKQFVEKAQDLLAEVNSDTDVIIIEPKLDKRSSYAKWLQKNTEFRVFEELLEPQLINWLVKLAEEQSVELGQKEARILINRAGTNQALLYNELQKLLLLGSKTITVNDIERMVDAVPQSTVFELLDSAFAGNTKKALKLYSEQRQLKVEPQQILAMIGWQLYILALVKSAGDKPQNLITKESGIHPYVIQKSSNLAKRISATRLKHLIRRVLDMDLITKTTPADADELIMALIVDIAVSNPS